MRKFLISASILAFLVATNIQAKSTGGVSLITKSYKEFVKIDKNGNKKVVLKEAKKIIPGDLIVYKNSIKNHTDKEVKNMVLNNAIPKHTEYIQGSAKCQKKCKILFSVDGGKVFKTADKLMIKRGKHTRLALPKEYTNIRWVLTSSLSAHSTTNVSFKTRLK